jgi:hypothetical protein
LLLALGSTLFPLPLFSAPLTLGEPMAVPGTKGGFDFLQVGQPLHRLLADHTGNKTLDVFDLPEGKLIKSVATGAAQGVAIDTAHDSYYVTVSDLEEISRGGSKNAGCERVGRSGRTGLLNLFSENRHGIR